MSQDRDWALVNGILAFREHRHYEKWFPKKDVLKSARNIFTFTLATRAFLEAGDDENFQGNLRLYVELVYETFGLYWESALEGKEAFFTPLATTVCRNKLLPKGFLVAKWTRVLTKGRSGTTFMVLCTDGKIRRPTLATRHKFALFGRECDADAWIRNEHRRLSTRGRLSQYPFHFTVEEANNSVFYV